MLLAHPHALTVPHQLEEFAMSDHTIPARPKTAGNVTPSDAATYPWFYCSTDGPGRRAAERSRCEHGYPITDSCPCCP
jgi:hypothetical protein